MLSIGVDLHTNKFTACYRTENSDLKDSKDKETKTFDLTADGIKAFIKTLSKDAFVLIEATTATFCFARIIKPYVKDVVIGNTRELKVISHARNNTDKIDADKLSLEMAIMALTGVSSFSRVTIPPEEIQDLRGLFSTYQLIRKQTVQLKNRIHSLLKERLYGFTKKEIFSRRMREEVRALEAGTEMAFQINLLMDELEHKEGVIEKVKKRILLKAEPFMSEISILTSMSGISVFIAAAIIADIMDVGRFKNSKHFTSYLRSAPKTASSNTSVSVKGTNKMGRKLSAALLTQSLNHALKASPKLSSWYERLARYKKPGLVRTGLRRRVLAEIYQMLKKGEYHYDRKPENHERKLSQYRNFLEKQKILVKSA